MLKIEFRGPFSTVDPENNPDSPTDYVYWKFKKGERVLLLRATTSPKLLNAEENIIGKKGLNASILEEKGGEIDKEYTTFPLDELEKKVEKITQ